MITDTDLDALRRAVEVNCHDPARLRQVAAKLAAGEDWARAARSCLPLLDRGAASAAVGIDSGLRRYAGSSRLAAPVEGRRLVEIRARSDCRARPCLGSLAIAIGWHFIFSSF